MSLLIAISLAPIQYLSPMEFDNIPMDVRTSLTKLGCTIPQPHPFFRLAEHQNIVSGEFGGAGQTDWAALCSRDGRSEIIVIWGGTQHCPGVVVEKRPDRSSMQSMGPHGMVYSRAIGRFPASIKTLFKMDEGVPEKRAHDAISDTFLDKGGSAAYCHEGKWIEFGTAD